MEIQITVVHSVNYLNSVHLEIKLILSSASQVKWPLFI